MYGSSFIVFLKNQDARPFGKVGIIFDDNSFSSTCNDISYKNIVLNQFIISMRRYTELALFNESQNFPECFAHSGNYTSMRRLQFLLYSSCTDSHFCPASTTQ